jgi:hypothetical protein
MEEKFTDFTFEDEDGGVLKAHKNVLYEHPFFQNYLNDASHFESGEDKMKVGDVKIVKPLINILYSHHSGERYRACKELETIKTFEFDEIVEFLTCVDMWGINIFPVFYMSIKNIIKNNIETMVEEEEYEKLYKILRITKTNYIGSWIATLLIDNGASDYVEDDICYSFSPFVEGRKIRKTLLYFFWCRDSPKFCSALLDEFKHKFSHFDLPDKTFSLDDETFFWKLIEACVGISNVADRSNQLRSIKCGYRYDHNRKWLEILISGQCVMDVNVILSSIFSKEMYKIESKSNSNKKPHRRRLFKSSRESASDSRSRKSGISCTIIKIEIP